MKNVILTIDTEGHDGENPIDKLIWGKAADGKEYGINHIMDICDSYSIKALFFVDMAEAWDYGKDKIAKVTTHIRNRGHDVGVHIHPDHMADKNRLFLWEYTKEEQRDIIMKCTDLYKEILGEPPLAFRAGKYGANYDTLDILDELGYKFDFSQFYGQKWCGINPPVTITMPARYKNIIEIPVTVFRSFKLDKLIRFDKVDITMDRSEYKYIMNRIASDNRNIIISLFYHSFSMLDWRENPDNPDFSLKEENKFIEALKYVHESKSFRFLSLSELFDYKIFNNADNADNADNAVATKGLLLSSWFSLKRALAIRKYNKKAKRLIYGLLGIAIISLSLISLLFIAIISK